MLINVNENEGFYSKYKYLIIIITKTVTTIYIITNFIIIAITMQCVSSNNITDKNESRICCQFINVISRAAFIKYLKHQVNHVHFILIPEKRIHQNTHGIQNTNVISKRLNTTC